MSLKESQNVVVIGAGISGLCTAYFLTRKGHQVTLIDKSIVGSGASSKAAGMLTPSSEVHLGENSLVALFLNSCDHYTRFIEQITNGRPDLVDYQRKGSLQIATEPDGQKELIRLAEFQHKMGFHTKTLAKHQINDKEPFLSQRTLMAVYAEDEGCVDNRKLIQTLKQKLIESDLCTILENKSIAGITFQDRHIQSITLEGPEAQTLNADVFVCTTGVDSLHKDLANRVNIPLRGVKGQALEIQAKPGQIKHPLRIYHRYPIYLVPRSDGRIIIGATNEELTDQNVTAGGLMDLIYAAWQTLPFIYDCPVLDTWAGLRPTTKDHKPVIGKTNVSNLFMLTGLYRHGIMVGPYLARELVSLIEGEWTDMDLKEFSPERFY